MKNKFLPYDPKLRKRARILRSGCTFSENILWSKIRKKSLGYEFHRQVPIGSFIVDFYCHELMLAIEIDGNSHDNKQEYDKVRQEELESMGITFIRFDNMDINHHMVNVLRVLSGKIDDLEEKNK